MRLKYQMITLSQNIFSKSIYLCPFEENNVVRYQNYSFFLGKEETLEMNDLLNEQSLFYIQKGYWEKTDEHQENYKEVIRQREKTRIPFLHQSPQIALRPKLVEYLRRICMEKKFTHSCLHLSIYLMDTFMDCHSIETNKVLSLANVCLLIAAKLEENIGRVPKISEVNALVGHRYTVREHKILELMILNYFSWYIMFPTVPHYTYYYLQNTITSNDIHMSKCQRRTILYRLNDVLLEYLNQIIDNVHYMQDFKPSILAATIIAAARVQIGLSMWNEELEKVTSYTKEEIDDVLFTILFNRYYNKSGSNQKYPLNQLCTFRGNCCLSCNISSCAKCNFLYKLRTF